MKKLIAAILAACMVLSGSFAFAASTIDLIQNGDGYTVAASHEMKEKQDEMMKKHGDMKHDHDKMMEKHDHKMKEKHDEMKKKHGDMKHQHDQMKKEYKNHTTPEKKE